MTERGGGCGFGEKVMNAQTAGAIGIVVINNSPGTSAMMVDETQAAEVRIPAFMVKRIVEPTVDPFSVFMSIHGPIFLPGVSGSLRRPQGHR